MDFCFNLQNQSLRLFCVTELEAACEGYWIVAASTHCEVQQLPFPETGRYLSLSVYVWTGLKVSQMI